MILIVTLVFHYLNGGIRLQTPFQRVTPQVKVHISVILALMALTKTVQYYLARFGLTLSHRGVVDGATYTDVKAQLPALNLLMLISVAAAILFIANIFRRGWVFPIIAVGLWGFISIVVGTIYPAVIQRFVVQPNEYAREQTYIKRNIDATRDRVRPRQDPRRSRSTTTPTSSRSRSPSRTTRRRSTTRGSGTRTRCRTVLAATEEFQPFYSFSDVDVDRYTIERTGDAGAHAACVSSTPTQLPSNTWTNRHLVYTHGYGIDTAHGQRAQRRPADVPALRHPDEGSDGRARAHAARRVLRRRAQRLLGRRQQGRRARGQRRAAPPRRRSTRATAACRCRTSPRRLAFALRFGDFNLVYSGQVTTGSRILYLRDIQERVQTAAPFLQWDADPYAVEPRRQDRVGPRRLHDARTVPVLAVDQPATCRRAADSNTNLNYVRNSVKATVDAYDGTIHFYVVDPSDPIIRTYEKAFPDLFDNVNDDAGRPARRTGATPKTSSTCRPSSTRSTT